MRRKFLTILIIFITVITTAGFAVFTSDTLLPIVRQKEIPNSKKQITNKSQITNSKFQTFENWNLDIGNCLELGNCDLEFQRVDSINPGDYVLSLNEETGKLQPSRINALFDMGVKPIYKITTEDGKTIRTTAEHPYLVLPKPLAEEDLAKNQKAPAESQDFLTRRPVELNHILAKSTTQVSTGDPNLRISASPHLRSDYYNEAIIKNNISNNEDVVFDTLLSNVVPVDTRYFQYTHQQNPVKTPVDNAEWTKVAELSEGDEIAVADQTTTVVVWDKIAKIEILPAEHPYLVLPKPLAKEDLAKTKNTEENSSASFDSEGAEFPLSRRMDVSQSSRAIVHGHMGSQTGVYIQPQSLALGLKLGQDSSATSLQDYYSINQRISSTKNPTTNGEILEDSTLQGISRVDADIINIANGRFLSSVYVDNYSNGVNSHEAVEV